MRNIFFKKNTSPKNQIILFLIFLPTDWPYFFCCLVHRPKINLVSPYFYLSRATSNISCFLYTDKTVMPVFCMWRKRINRNDWLCQLVVRFQMMTTSTDLFLDHLSLLLYFRRRNWNSAEVPISWNFLLALYIFEDCGNDSQDRYDMHPSPKWVKVKTFRKRSAANG